MCVCWATSQWESETTRSKSIWRKNMNYIVLCSLFLIVEYDLIIYEECKWWYANANDINCFDNSPESDEREEYSYLLA